MSDMTDDDDMGYELADVDAAEKRIRAECPGARIRRGNYDWSLAVAKADKSVAFLVFDAGKNKPTIIGDVDKIIAELNS